MGCKNVRIQTLNLFSLAQGVGEVRIRLDYVIS